MATVTKPFLVDDLDGSTEDVENVRISLDGANFEIDLSAANAVRLREKPARYVGPRHPRHAAEDPSVTAGPPACHFGA